MKYIWEESDIRGGRHFRKPDCEITGEYIIAWKHRTKDEDHHVYGAVSMADGMWIKMEDGTKKDVADWLNRAGYYHPVSIE